MFAKKSQRQMHTICNIRNVAWMNIEENLFLSMVLILMYLSRKLNEQDQRITRTSSAIANSNMMTGEIPA